MGKGSEELMEAARNSASEERAASAHKLKVMLQYKVRKQVRNSPRKLVTQIGALSPIPGVGTVVSLAVEVLLDKAVAARKERKRSKYAADRRSGTDERESLRKHAKAQAKDHKGLVEKIDGNLVKLKDASGKIIAAISEFNAARNSSDIDISEKAWNLALKLYDTQYYEEKIQVLVEAMHLRLDAVSEYIASSTINTAKLEDDLFSTLEEMEDSGKEIGSLNQSRRDNESDIAPLLRQGVPRSDSFRG